MNRAIIFLTKTYGFRFAQEYAGWRKHRGFGATEALNRIRSAKKVGLSPMTIK